MSVFYDNAQRKSSPAESALRRAEFHVDLEDSAPFNPEYRLIPEHRSLVQMFAEQLKCPGHKPAISQRPRWKEETERNLECLLANLIAVTEDGRACLAFSQNNTAYQASALTRGVIDQVKLAEACGFIKKVNGYHDRLRPWNSVTARIWLTQAGRRFLKPYLDRDLVTAPPADLIELRQTQKQPKRGKQSVPMPRAAWRLTIHERQTVRAVEYMLRGFNAWLDASDIRYTDARGNVRPLRPQLRAIYNGALEHGGRLYTGRGGHQNLAKAQRATITINGQPTVELDYGGLHIRMLYHLAGEDYPIDGDPYSDVLQILGLPNDRSIRGDLKTTLLALINGRGSEAQTTAWAYTRLFGAYVEAKEPAARHEILSERAARAERWAEAGLVRDGEPDVSRVLAAFRQAHQPIAEYFSSGIGLTLQNIDAQIARSVLWLMMDDGECVLTLPQHDSFIVPKPSETRLRLTMTWAYQAVMSLKTGQNRVFRIPIRK